MQQGAESLHLPAAVPCPSAPWEGHGAAAGWGIFPGCAPHCLHRHREGLGRADWSWLSPGLPPGSPKCTPGLPAAIPAGIPQLLSRIHQPWLLQLSLAHPWGGCIPLPSAGWWDRQHLGEATGLAQPHIHIPAGPAAIRA